VDELAEGPGVVSGVIDARRLADVRESLPALKHRTM
jgi:nitrilase